MVKRRKSGYLNEILPEPISERNERILLDLLKRKMYVIAEIAVQLLHAMEEKFGPEAREVVREMSRNQRFETRGQFGEPASDLHEFCAMVDQTAAGTHKWERVINEPDCVTYNFTRCMYAEIFRELGEPELGYVLCSRDEPWVKSYNPKLSFKRTKELMGGDDICDNTYYVQE